MSVFNKDNSNKEQQPVVENNNNHQEKFDDDVAEILFMAPDIFMAKATLELMKLPLATKRRRARELAIDARNIGASQSNDRYAARQWKKVAWDLQSLR